MSSWWPHRNPTHTACWRLHALLSEAGGRANFIGTHAFARPALNPVQPHADPLLAYEAQAWRHASEDKGAAPAAPTGPRQGTLARYISTCPAVSLSLEESRPTPRHIAVQALAENHLANGYVMRTNEGTDLPVSHLLYQFSEDGRQVQRCLVPIMETQQSTYPPITVTGGVQNVEKLLSDQHEESEESKGEAFGESQLEYEIPRSSIPFDLDNLARKALHEDPNSARARLSVLLEHRRNWQVTTEGSKTRTDACIRLAEGALGLEDSTWDFPPVLASESDAAAVEAAMNKVEAKAVPEALVSHQKTLQSFAISSARGAQLEVEADMLSHFESLRAGDVTQE